MANICGVPIPKMDVLMEDFSNIRNLIDNIASNKEQLIASRNTWEVFFMGYDDDPREIPEIPEVVNWIEQSVENGIPWFYFMSPAPSSGGLSTFMICCGAVRDPKQSNRYVFDRDKVMPFIHKNLDNLAEFVEKHNIPVEVGCAATDDIMEYIRQLLQGSADQKDIPETLDRSKQRQEAIDRLSTLEQLFGLNPNAKKYFEAGRLYYSYLTGGGYIGSIDTITYDARYAAIVEAFEEQTSGLVYHVIERGNTISLLYVSDDYNNWLDERPNTAGIMAQTFDTRTYENSCGYIKINCLQGALYRINDTVYPSMPDKTETKSCLLDVDSEILERLEILKNGGIITDLDIAAVYMQEGEICCSILQSIMGTPVAVINRISAKKAYVQLMEIISRQIPMKIYFLMGSAGQELAFLYLSDDSKAWETEKLALEQGQPYAVVVDLEAMTAKIRRISYKMVNGGPIFTCD